MFATAAAALCTMEYVVHTQETKHTETHVLRGSSRLCDSRHAHRPLEGREDKLLSTLRFSASLFWPRLQESNVFSFLKQGLHTAAR